MSLDPIITALIIFGENLYSLHQNLNYFLIISGKKCFLSTLSMPIYLDYELQSDKFTVGKAELVRVMIENIQQMKLYIEADKENFEENEEKDDINNSFAKDLFCNLQEFLKQLRHIKLNNKLYEQTLRSIQQYYQKINQIIYNILPYYKIFDKEVAILNPRICRQSLTTEQYTKVNQHIKLQYTKHALIKCLKIYHMHK
jgi:hypothetical protein